MVVGEELLAIPFLWLLLLWSGVWKAWAVWRAARNKHLAWYIALWILNTAGILEIVYIFGFSGYRKGKAAVKKK